MSVRATNFVRKLRGLSPQEKAVAFVLADHDNHKGGGAYPSMATVAEESGIANRETASRITKRLVNYKVFLAPQPSKGGRPTIYFPNYELANCDSPVTVARPRTVISPSPSGFSNCDSARDNHDFDSVENAPTMTQEALNRDPQVTGRVEGKTEKENYSGEGEEAAHFAQLAATAFQSIHCEPFGDPKFQNIWIEEWQSPNGSFADAMERTIQRCKREKPEIKVPGRFFTHKKEIEKLEAQKVYKVTPL